MFRGEKCDHCFIWNVFETKKSFKSTQCAESDEIKIFKKNFQKPAQNWEINKVFFLRLR